MILQLFAKLAVVPAGGGGSVLAKYNLLDLVAANIGDRGSPLQAWWHPLTFFSFFFWGRSHVVLDSQSPRSRRAVCSAWCPRSLDMLDVLIGAYDLT